MTIGRFLVFLILVGAGVMGGLSGWFASANLRPTDHASYAVFRDLTTIMFAMFTITLTIAIAIGSYLIRKVVLYEVRGEVEGIVGESRAQILSEVHRVAARMWGMQYEATNTELDLGEMIYHAERAVKEAENVDKRKHWELYIPAVNNYLMSLAYQQLTGQAEAHHRRESNKYARILEDFLDRHARDMDQEATNRRRETLYLTRASFSDPESEERAKAVADFSKLKEDPQFKQWRNWWKRHHLLES